MQLSPVLTSAGEPMWSFGGNQSWKTFEHRGYIVSLEWVGSGKKATPSMCIWAASNIFVPGSNGSGTWVIGRRAITEFVGFTKDLKCTGSASEHCYRECLEALPILGKDKNDKQAFVALVDCVIRFAPDLVHMPVTPKSIREANENAMWEVTATDKNSGKTLSEATV